MTISFMYPYTVQGMEQKNPTPPKAAGTFE